MSVTRCSCRLPGFACCLLLPLPLSLSDTTLRLMYCFLTRKLCLRMRERTQHTTLVITTMSKSTAPAAVPPTMAMNSSVHSDASPSLSPSLPSSGHSMQTGCSFTDVAVLYVALLKRSSPSVDIVHPAGMASSRVTLAAAEVAVERFKSVAACSHRLRSVMEQ